MTDTARPLARTLAPSDVSPAGTHVRIDAGAAERAALAAAADIPAVETLTAELVVRPWSGDGFSISGRLKATVTQTCVVTLEPIAAVIDEEIDVKLVPPEAMAKYEIKPDENGEIDLDASALDLPEPLEGGVIDVGGLVCEHFMLSLDPYPKKPGAVFDAEAAGVGDGREILSPFAALAKLEKE